MSYRRAAVLLCVCVAWVLVAQYLTVNVSASVPRGFYFHPRQAMPLTRGTLVLVPRTTIGRPWWQFPWLLMRPLKPVAGIAGDRVCVQPEGVWVNDGSLVFPGVQDCANINKLCRHVCVSKC